MKTKSLLILLLVFCSVSCDRSELFLIDGQKEYTLSTECGTLKIKGSSLSTLPILMSCSFNGGYRINIDSLKMEAIPKEITFKNIRFLLNDKTFTGSIIEAKKGDVLTIWLELESATSFRRESVTVLLLPSDFILCNNKPMLTDTVRIRLMN